MNEITNYNIEVEAIKTAILNSQYIAARQVNSIQLALYYGVGRYVSQRSRKNAWGMGALQTISDQLHRELPGLRGFSATNMKFMRLFYEAWSELSANSSAVVDELQISNSEPNTILSTMADDLEVPQFSFLHNSGFLDVPFTHHTIILSKVKDVNERMFYIRHCAINHLSKTALKDAIARQEHLHAHNMSNNFSATMPTSLEARKAVEMFKDEYMLQFINIEEMDVRDRADIDERVVENRIVHNIKHFMMTFGKDFAFVGNQYHLEVYNKEQFPDLLFFNRELNCLVCIDLKIGEFKPIYFGQLTTYLRILDDKVRKPHENPSIGIILCQDYDRDFVEYIVQDYSHPMGVARYKTFADMPEHLRNSLPDMDAVKRIVKKELDAAKNEEL